MVSVDQSYFSALNFASRVNRQAISSCWSSCTIIGGGPDTINLPKSWFVYKLCGEMSWKSWKMPTVPAFYLEPANQNPRFVVSGPREDANPSVNDKLRSYTVTACPRFGALFRF